MNRDFIRSISYSLASNIVNFVSSAFIAFIIPRYLGIKEYAFWQLYAFYMSYKGLFHLGWLDGIYLRYGGQKFEELNREQLHEQLLLFFFFECIVSVGIFLATYCFCSDSDKQFVFIAFGCACIVYLINTFFELLLQATGKIPEYAKCVFFTRFIYASLTMLFLFTGARSFKWMIIADLLSALFTSILLTRVCRDIIINRFVSFQRACLETKENIKTGSKLLIGNIGGTLIIGIVRQTIEIKWGIEEFGKVSFALSISNMMILFVSAVSLALYPVIKNKKERELRKFFSVAGCISRSFIYILLLIYFPMKYVLDLWLPQYHSSMHFLGILFPICLFDGLYYFLVATYLKALRKENIIMYINWAAVLSEMLLLLFIKDYLILVIVSIPVILALRCHMGIAYVSGKLNVEFLFDNIFEDILIIVFTVAAWNESIVGIILYLFLYSFFLVKKCRDLKKIPSYFK